MSNLFCFTSCFEVSIFLSLYSFIQSADVEYILLSYVLLCIWWKNIAVFQLLMCHVYQEQIAIWRMDENKEDGAKSMEGIACVIVSNTMLYFNIMMS